jgi:hypothetical protein
MSRMSSNANLLKFRPRRDSLTLDASSSTAASSSSSSNSSEPKRFLRQSGFNQIISEIIVGVCRRFLEFPLQKRITVYLVLVVIGGLIADLAPGLAAWIVPFRTQKTNPLNVYFVKLGWAWTITLLLPFVVIIGRTIENRGRWAQPADLARVLVATCVWFISTSLFVHIETVTGSCSSTTYRSRPACVRAGHRWHGFDISGHTFILLYSSLMIIEETKSMVGFESLGYLLDSRAQLRSRVHRKADVHRDLYMKYLVPVRLLFVALTLLTLLWDVMLVQTIFFYHSFLQKVLAYIWAVFVWYLTYKCLYPTRLAGLLRLPIRPPTKLEDN